MQLINCIIKCNEVPRPINIFMSMYYSAPGPRPRIVWHHCPTVSGAKGVSHLRLGATATKEMHLSQFSMANNAVSRYLVN